MNCQEIQRHLNDYLDGTLPETQRQAIGNHVGSCLTCRRELEALRSVVNRARDLPSEIEPDRDLWPEIEPRLDSVRPIRSETRSAPSQERPWWLQLAAAVITLAVLSVPLSVWLTSRQADDRDSTPTAVQTLGDTEIEYATMTTQAVLARSEDGVMLARTDLVTAIEQRRDLVADDTLQVFEENMHLLDEAIGELRTALEEDPYNRRLRMLLANRYQQERKLLQKASRV